MVRPIQFIKILLLLSLLSYNVQADEPLIPIHFTGHYDFAFSGIPFGEIDITFTEKAGNYRATSDIETTGVARLLVQHSSHTTSHGSGRNFHYANAEYESRYSTRGKKKYARISKKNGRIVSDKVEPPDNRSVRPAVPLAEKSAAVDPLAMSVAIRNAFARARQEGRTSFTLDFYDGRRLTRSFFTLGDERVLRINAHKIPVFTLHARRKPLAGYTAKELARINPNEPELTIYFSHDVKFVPIYMEVPLPFGVATATLRI